MLKVLHVRVRTHIIKIYKLLSQRDPGTLIIHRLIYDVTAISIGGGLKKNLHIILTEFMTSFKFFWQF